MKRHATDLAVMAEAQSPASRSPRPDARSRPCWHWRASTVGAIDDSKDRTVVLERWRGRRPVAMSQMRAVPSAEAVARRELSGLKATHMTVLLCLKGPDTGSPVRAFQMRAVPSKLPVASNRPSRRRPRAGPRACET